ncbi:MAG: class I SAM-dependent methyltransferase [Chitinophagaceae bacterium]|nr:class I SAM-dependent methyltransferase [Chitinophagaceae bacterium]
MLFQSHGICPVCNTPGKHWCTTQDWEYRATTHYYSYLNCPACHTLFLEELKEDNLLNIYPPNYYSFSQKTKKGLFKLKDRLDALFYKSVLKKIPTTGLSVLDVGGGTGNVLDTLKKADKRINYTEIIDIDLNAKEIAEKKGHVYVCTSAETYHTNKKFDIILLLNIIEHISNPARLIQKATDMLTDNGFIIIKTPNAKSLDARLFKNYYWGGLHCPRHWIIFNESSFKLMCSDKKLNIESIRFTQGAAFWAYSIINLFRKQDINLKKKPLLESPFFPFVSIFFAIMDLFRSFFSTTSQMFIILKK